MPQLDRFCVLSESLQTERANQLVGICLVRPDEEAG